jgi:hypothetical protein
MVYGMLEVQIHSSLTLAPVTAISFMLRPFCPHGKSPAILRLIGNKRRFGRFEEEMNFPLFGIEPSS